MEGFFFCFLVILIFWGKLNNVAFTNKTNKHFTLQFCLLANQLTERKIQRFIWRLLGPNQLKPNSPDKLWRSNNNIYSNTPHVFKFLDYFLPLWVPFAKNCYVCQFQQNVSKMRKHVNFRNIHSLWSFPNVSQVYHSFTGILLRIWACEQCQNFREHHQLCKHSSTFCEQFEQWPNFASIFY